MDPRAYGAVGPSIETLLSLSDCAVAARGREQGPHGDARTDAQIDPAAQVFERRWSQRSC